jgi:hypothetical protein
LCCEFNVAVTGLKKGENTMIFEVLLIAVVLTVPTTSEYAMPKKYPESQNNPKLHVTIRQQIPKTTGRYGWRMRCTTNSTRGI